MNKIAYEQDCEIIRKDEFAIIYDCEGEEVIKVSNQYNDDDLWLMLRIANRFYDLGIESGKFQKAMEIKKSLGIES